jgi:hypothetical protein
MVAFLSDGVNVYWSDETGLTPNVAGSSQQLFKCSVMGCGNSPLSIYAGSGVPAIAADSLNIYWTTGTPVVDRCLTSGCVSPVDIDARQDPATISGALVVDQDNVYWSNADGKIMRCSKTGCGGAPTNIKSTGQDVPLQMVLDTNSIYYFVWIAGSTGTTGEIFSCAKSGCGDNPTVIASGLYYPAGLATDGISLYWTELSNAGVSGQEQAGSGLVRKCAVGGCGNSPATLASGLTFPRGIAVDDQYVFWVEAGSNPNDDGRIWQSPK